MDLYDVIYISYLVPMARIHHFIPPILSLAVDESERTYVSFVAMRCRRVKLSIFPWPCFHYDQLNLRTYVIDPITDTPAVYFFRSGVSLGIVPMLTRIISIPWERITFQLDENYSSRYYASGNWLGELYFEIELSTEGVQEKSIIDHLTGPMIGFMGSQNKLRRFKITHQALEVQSAVLRKIRFPLPVEKGLVMDSELQKPDSVLIVPEAKFTVYLPPRSISERG
jgi:hypothetical protein